MAKRQAIIRKLPAVETLGSTTIICSDKTGTLTENRMTVQAIVTANKKYDVTGTGYDPTGGQVTHRDDAVDLHDHPALAACLRAGALCNDSRLRNEDEDWLVQGDPTEGALLVAAGKAGLAWQVEELAQKRLAVIPFESEHQYMAVLCATDSKDTNTMYVKGSLEKILAACSLQLEHSGTTSALDERSIHKQAAELAAQGLRVLAFAEKSLPGTTESLGYDDIDELTFIGLQGMMDPPRKEAADAVRSCLQAGIKVKMITGDHGLTAAAIAHKIGLIDAADAGEDSPLITTGRELAEIPAPDLPDVAASTVVFSRTSPEQKLRLVNALQARNNIVAMTGDGVNDAPALKRADAGIAMGLKGSEAAKEAADLVLADDNFASIAAAVREGRTVYDNIKKVISWTLPTNAGEAMIIMAALFAGTALPITAVQILWVNLITGVTLGLALAFEPSEPGTMNRPPRARGEPLLTGTLIWQIVFVSTLISMTVFGMYFYATDKGYPTTLARSIAMNTLVVLQIFYLFFIRKIYDTSLKWAAAKGTPIVWICVTSVTVAQLAVTYLPPFQIIFDTHAVPLFEGVLIIAIGIAFFALIETEKQMRLAFLPRNTDQKR
jgi:potassium/sodium efflux P-type ATPase